MRTLFILLFSLGITQANAQYTNLVLEGGGMKGIAYAGAFEILDSLGISDSIERIAGTSSGAMNGLMYSLGYTGKEIRQMNLITNFGKYNQVGVPLIGGLIRVKRTYGYYKTDRLIEDLGTIMQMRGFSRDLTFSELYQAKEAGRNIKLLYLIGVNLNDQEIEIFSHETYPNMRVLDAVRISISIPLYFEAIWMQPDGKLIEKRDADSTTKIMADGGILDNYPFYVFDTLVSVNGGANSYYKCNIHTLGIKLETDSSQVDISPKSIRKTSDYLSATGLISSEYLNRRNLGRQQMAQTIFVNTKNFNPRIKRQNKTIKIKVMNYGKEATLEFFNSQ
ncbi:patatin-like phospholipase family protein [Bacteroidia bacterium]|nr:patatin-like phospholipase family protein [Bacteroidia bacterium]